MGLACIGLAALSDTTGTHLLRSTQRRRRPELVARGVAGVGGDAVVPPFRVRYKDFEIQVPGEVILALFTNMTVLLALLK